MCPFSGGRECPYGNGEVTPMDSGGLTVSKVNVHTEFNQYYVQFQETIKIYAHYIQHLHALCSTRQNTVKFRKISASMYTPLQI